MSVASKLSIAQTRSAERNYLERMSMERAAQHRRRDVRQANIIAHNMMFGPPEDLSRHPLLSDLWETTVGAHLIARRARLRAMREEAILLPTDQAPPVRPNFRLRLE